VLAPLHGAFLFIQIAILVVCVFALIDAMSRKAQSFVYYEKQTKQFWVAVLAVAAIASFLGFLTFIALVAALVYLLDVRPAVSGR
jgi:uncharacterized membrane protein